MTCSSSGQPKQSNTLLKQSLNIFCTSDRNGPFFHCSHFHMTQQGLLGNPSLQYCCTVHTYALYISTLSDLQRTEVIRWRMMRMPANSEQMVQSVCCDICLLRIILQLQNENARTVQCLICVSCAFFVCLICFCCMPHYFCKCYPYAALC